MRNRILLAALAVLLAGGLVRTIAQVNAGSVNPTTTRVKSAKEITPSWTYKGEWRGFITCNRLQKDGNMSKPNDVKECLAAKGTCVLISPGGQGQGRLDLQPVDKCNEYAGQQVLVTGLMTSSRYGTGPTSDEAVAGFASGGDRPAAKFQGLTIISAKILPPEPPSGKVDTSRMTQSSQE